MAKQRVALWESKILTLGRLDISLSINILIERDLSDGEAGMTDRNAMPAAGRSALPHSIIS